MDTTILIPILVIIGAIFAAIWFLNKKNTGSEHIGRTAMLDLYSKDLTALAKLGKLDPVVGRKHEIHRVIEILDRRTKNNPVLIGKSGVGKTAIVEELANAIAENKVPDILKNRRLLALDLSGLVAGTKYRGEFEKRLKMLVDELIAAERNVILFIDELHSLADAGEATGAIDAADILKPALARGELQVIGATTQEDFKKYIETDQTLERRFQPIYVDEPSPEETRKMLDGIKSRYEQFHNVHYTNDALDAAIGPEVQHLKSRVFPDKAIDLLDESGSRVRLLAVEQHIEGTLDVNSDHIQQIISEWKDK
jgi:ATP-dependent Clp protease ATP-binding subunit ClpC